MTTQSNTYQVIYINWNLGNHTYTMTINLSSNPQYWALQSLKDWVKYNSPRVISWSFDDNSNGTIDQFETVRFLINSNSNYKV